MLHLTNLVPLATNLEEIPNVEANSRNAGKGAAGLSNAETNSEPENARRRNDPNGRRAHSLVSDFERRLLSLRHFYSDFDNAPHGFRDSKSRASSVGYNLPKAL